MDSSPLLALLLRKLRRPSGDEDDPRAPEIADAYIRGDRGGVDPALLLAFTGLVQWIA